ARGMSMAAGAVGDSAMLGLDVSLRDSGSDAATAARQVEALAREGAIAVVGPVSDADVAAVTVVASKEGLPVLSLAPRPRSPGQGVVFHVAQSAEDRARALARYAIRVGARDVAILAPKSGYGRAVGAAFRAEIEQLGGTVVSAVEYEPGETSFGKVVRSVRGPWQAVFVPDQAAKLALIAPALAAGNLQSRPEGKGKTKVGRPILLLSTAEAVDDRYLRSAGRYSYGAVLAPGFYPDRTDAFIARFVDRFREAFGREPGTWEAHAFDAALMVRQAVDAGARSRAEVAAALAGTPVQGLTGTLRFGADGMRADGGLLFTVDKAEGADQYLIRARR
ncbi:MAG TPA: penicillin-binding protein activator, partial [Kofleriaceae bacterium]|nr:penicillin-binding protein activator [Kofleriaceae bacterium]